MNQNTKSDNCFNSAVQQISMIRDRDISCKELLDLHIGNLKKYNPKVNAIVTQTLDLARISAEKSDQRIRSGENIGILEGLPVAIKDLQMTEGILTTEGSRIYKNRIPKKDSLIVSRIKNSGGVIIGKSNTPEFGAGSQTFNDVFGPTLNPYDLSKTCGGSSGGSAVALACGMSSIATGSDLGGSLRNPAAWCNVVGFRPTLGVVPSFTDLPWNTLSTDGPMARTVEDIVLQLKAISGKDEYIANSYYENIKFDLEKFLQKKPDKLKIAWGGNLGDRPIDNEILSITKDSLRNFTGMGFEVYEDYPDLSYSDEVFNAFRAYKFAFDHQDHIKKYPDLVKDTIKWNTENGIQLRAVDLGKMEQFRNDIWKKMISFFQNYDLFALPVTSVPPFSVDVEYPTKIDGVELQTYLDWMWPCYVISVTGMPSVSIPCGFNSDNLPVGLQLIASPFKDFDLLSSAYIFQENTKFHKIKPPICV